MKRIVNIAKNHQEAHNWEIKQALEMSHEERQKAARVLKKRVFGNDQPDVREGHQKAMAAG